MCGARDRPGKRPGRLRFLCRSEFYRRGDASIDLADFNIWLTTVPPTAPLMDAVPVPEPMTMAMFGLVGLLAAGCRP